jgi:hypothetical protein
VPTLKGSVGTLRFAHPTREKQIQTAGLASPAYEKRIEFLR